MLLGTEPSRGWKTFAEETLDAISVADVSGIVFLGAMLADVPHTRPITVFASSENPAVREQFDLERSSYEGPVGIISVLADAAERAGIPTISIWASVPHYVHNAPSPKATLALIEKLESFIELADRPRFARRGFGGLGERNRRARERRRRHGRVHPAARAGARHRRLPRGER